MTVEEPRADGTGARALEVDAALAAHAPVGLLSVDASGVVRAVNASAAALLARSHGDAVGARVAELFADESSAVCRDVIARALEGAPATGVAHVAGPDGTEAAIDLAARPGGPHGGCVASLQVHVTSAHEERLTTENARLSAAAADASDRLATIVDGLDAIVWEAELESGAFTFVSKRAETLLGYPVDAWLAEPDFWLDHVHPADRDACARIRDAQRAGERERAYEYRFLRADGRVVWLRDVAYVEPDETGAPRWMRGFMVDVTDAKHAEQHLRVQNAVARALLDAEDVDSATESAVRAVAQAMAWPAGVFWYAAHGERVMRPVRLAGATDDVIAALTRTLPYASLARGDGGAAAEAWRTGSVTTTPHPDPGAPSYASMTALGLRAVTAVPLGGRDGAHGVLEFFHDPADAPHGMAREALEHAGALVGLFVERRRAEERARDERVLRSAILEGALDAVVGVDAHGRVRAFNPAAERVFGCTRDDAAGEDVATFLEVESARSAYESAVAAVTEAETRGEAGARVQVTGLRRDATRFPAEVTIAEVPGDGTIAFSFTVRDITEAKAAEDELRRLVAALDRERDRLQDLVASVPGVVWEAWGAPDAAEQRIDFVSEHVETMLGYSREEWLSEPNFWLKVVHPDDRQKAAARAAEIFRSREPGANAFRWLRKDGSVMDVLAIARAIRDAEGRPVGMRGITLDVSSGKHAERRLALQLAVASRLAKATTLEDAAPALAADIARALDWTVGAYWLAPEDATGRLRCGAVWSRDASGAAAFEAASRTFTFAPGDGLPGRVYESGEPEWVRDVSALTDFPRGDAARRARLRGAFAFPVKYGDRVVGVLEFFTHETLDPDDQLLDASRAVTTQVQAFLDRARARQRVSEENARRAAFVEASLDAIVSMDADGRVTEWNPAAERTFGWSRAEALGRSMSDLIVPLEYRDAHHAGVQRQIGTGESRVMGKRLHLPALTKDRGTIMVELTIMRVTVDGQPEFTAFLREPEDASADA